MPDDKSLDDRLREMARHRGLKLVKSRRRKPGGDFGKYGLVDATSDEPCLGVGAGGLEAAAEDIEAYLRGSTADRWKTSLGSEPAPSRRPRKPADRQGKNGKDPLKTEPAPARPKTTRLRERTAKAPGKTAAEAARRPDTGLVVRDAEAADASAIAALVSGLGRPVDARMIGRSIRDGAKNGEPILLAVAGALAGMVSFHRFSVPHRRDPIGRITFLGVEASVRRRGIGRALVEAAVARLETLGCAEVEMIGEVGFGESARFARALGFEGRDYRFSRKRGVSRS